jgi:hypothetical protein
LLAEKQNLYVRVAAKEAIELSNSFQPAKTRSDDHNAFHGNLKFSTRMAALKLVSRAGVAFDISEIV